MKRCLLYWVVFVLFLCSCENKPKTIYFDTDYSSSSYLDEDDDAKSRDYSYSGSEKITIPYKEDGGVKIISVKVNGMRLDMIFDTGCSDALISVAEANYMYLKGLLTIDDILGTTKAAIADGSIVENTIVNLREVVIDDKIVCHNVQASVSKNISAPLLLGNEILDRVASYTIDNVDKTITFKLK